MSYLGLDPPQVRELSGSLRRAALDSRDLADAARRAVIVADLAAASPAHLADLAAAVDRAGMALAARADAALGFAIDRELLAAVLDVAAVVSRVVPLADCRPGPQTMVGAASPCDPVTRVEVYRLAAGLKIPFKVVALTLTREHAYRIEHLASGKLRVTRIDAFDAGIGPSAGVAASVAGGGRGGTLARSADLTASVLLHAADSYVIDERELDAFLIDDLLEEAALAGGPAPIFRPIGPVRRVAATLARVVDGLPLGPVHPLVTSLRDALGWKRPAPVSTFVEAGGGLRGDASLRDVLARLGVRIDGSSVAGVGRSGDETSVFVRLTGAAAAELALGTFGRRLGTQSEVQLALVLSHTGDVRRLEITQVATDDRHATRTTETIDLSGIDLGDLGALVGDLADPGAVARRVEALRRLAAGRVAVTRSEFDREAATVHRLEFQGTGVRFDVDTFRAR